MFPSNCKEHSELRELEKEEKSLLRKRVGWLFAIEADKKNKKKTCPWSLVVMKIRM